MKAPRITRRTAMTSAAALSGLAFVPNIGLAVTPVSTLNDLTLWYKGPAIEWTDALPLGNGRLGAMVFGGVARERLQLNEDTLYAGAPYQPANPTALTALPEVRKLIFAGKYLEAQELIQAQMMADPIRQVSYQTIGEMWLTFGVSSNASGYRRELDLTRALSTVTYRQDGVNFKRETFISPVDQVLVMRLTADTPGSIDFQLGFETPQVGNVVIDGVRDIVLSGRNGPHAGKDGALRFESRVRVVAEGGVQTSGTDELVVKTADSVMIFMAAATNYKSFRDVSGDPTAITKAQIDKAASKSWDQLYAVHLAEHQRLFNRVSVDFGRTAFADLATNERIAKSQTQDDPALAALYFQYGRYLLICCSRPGTQPANLQGLWNEKLNAPWGGKYTININTEMNYWPAEPTDLAECVDPLVAMVKDIAITGSETAKIMYGARGWVTHHNTDLWRATGPIDVLSLIVTCLGTALVASGAAAINQVDERDTDRLMVRTRQRPVADGRMGSNEGRAVAVGLSIAGLLILWFGANVAAMVVALATLLSYAFVYTPLKRRTSLATVVGAVPGALPPLIGWAASRGTVAEAAPWSLFLLMFLWQLPHFLAIAWLYREDYARAGLPMLSVVDREGVLTGRQATLWAATLVPFSVLPYLVGMAGPAYGAGAIVLGMVQLGLAINFAVRRTNASARTLFYGSITYLPLLWLLMVIDKNY